jgi:hypothetical protein
MLSMDRVRRFLVGLPVPKLEDAICGKPAQWELVIIDLQRLLADLPFQLGLLRVIPAALSEARKSVAWPLAVLVASAVQNVGVYLQGPCDFGSRGARFQPPDRGQVHFAREHSSRQSHDTILRLMKTVP